MKLNQMWIDDYEQEFRMVDFSFFKNHITKMFNNLQFVICNNHVYELQVPTSYGLFKRLNKDEIKQLLRIEKDNKELILELTTILLE